MISEEEWILMNASSEEIDKAIKFLELYNENGEIDHNDYRSMEIILAALHYIRQNKYLDEEIEKENENE